MLAGGRHLSCDVICFAVWPHGPADHIMIVVFTSWDGITAVTTCTLDLLYLYSK